MFWELNLAVLSELHCPDQVGTERSPGGGVSIKSLCYLVMHQATRLMHLKFRRTAEPAQMHNVQVKKEVGESLPWASLGHQLTYAQRRTQIHSYT